ncbi:MAG TPA: 3-deoxy-7-phosphoheptulonate synthase, partial [Acidimicrobiales bacterium]|nr:3-deoxy-7-phosphoheptulonate synthase [Acidimicrobiales bacterium]
PPPAGGAKEPTALSPPLVGPGGAAPHGLVWAGAPSPPTPPPAEDAQTPRHFEDVLAEVSGFFAAHRFAGTNPGGVHLELTGDDVTECLGGGAEVLTEDLSSRYETMCDPRLNGSQSVDLAFRLAELLRATSDLGA